MQVFVKFFTCHIRTLRFLHPTGFMRSAFVKTLVTDDTAVMCYDIALDEMLALWGSDIIRSMMSATSD